MNMSLQNKIISLIILLLVAGMSIFSFFSYSTGLATRERLARAEMRRTASMIATVHSLERTPDWRKTGDYLPTIIGLYSEGAESDLLELFYILVKDEFGGLAAYEVNYGLARQYGIKLTDSGGITLDEKSYENGVMVSSLIENSVPDMETIIMPVVVNGRVLGTIELGYLVKQLAAAERAAAARNTAALIVLCLLGALAAGLISRRVVSPILSVVRGMREVAAGNTAASAPLSGSGETRQLVDGFNAMAADLKRSAEEIEQKTRELSESENKYRSLFHSAGDGILLLDPDGVCLDANEEAAGLFNKPASELANTFIFDLVYPSWNSNDFSKCPERWSGTVSVPGARPREVETLLSEIGDGKCIAVIRDVTPWRDAERAILAVKKRQQKLIEDLPVGILILDRQMRIITCNGYLQSLISASPGETPGSSWNDLKALFGGGLEDEIRETLESGGESTVSEVSFDAGERGERLLEIRIGPFTEDPEKPPAVMIVVEDISEKAEMSRIHDELQQRMLQSQKLEALGTLAGGISQDFNNMLTAILGNIELMLENTSPDNKFYSSLLEVRKAAVRSRNLTMKLLAFARRDKISEKVVPINSVVGDLVEFLERGAGDEIKIKTSLCREAANIKTDVNQIFQALLNVCNNAIDAMPDGGTITLETSIVEDRDTRFGNGRFCKVSITDTGSGIPEKILNRIFDPFFTSKPPGAGTGLGLSISLGIIENHGGHISVSNRDAGGTMMDIFLPASEESPDSGKKPVPEVLYAGTETVLVIGGEKSESTSIKNRLNKAGYHPICASSCDEALDIFSGIGDSIEVILLDMAMPGTSGPDTYTKLAATGASVPFVIMSDTGAEDKSPFILKEKLVKGFVKKPFDAEQLYKTIREALSRGNIANS